MSTLLYENKQYTPEQLKQQFDKKKHESRYKISLRMITENNQEILDIGCNIGYMATYITDYKTYTGYDILPENIRIAQQLYPAKNREYTREQPTKKYDYVLALEIIEHIDNPGMFLQNIKNNIKNNGFLIISTPNAISITNILYNLKHRKYRRQTYTLNGSETDHVMNWDKITLQNLLVKNGYKIIQVKHSKPTIIRGQSIIIKAQKVD